MNTTIKSGILIYNISYLPDISVEKLPCIQPEIAWSISALSAKNVETLATTPPSIMPISGTNITSLNLIRVIMLMNSIVPSSANATAKNNLPIMLSAGKNINPSKIPSCAHSVVPAVVGDTNLLRVSCCITSPQTASDAPAMIIDTVRGRRLCISIDI